MEFIFGIIYGLGLLVTGYAKKGQYPWRVLLYSVFWPLGMLIDFYNLCADNDDQSRIKLAQLEVSEKILAELERQSEVNEDVAYNTL